MLEYSPDCLNADSYSGPAFSSTGERAREIYGDLLKVKPFEWEEIKVYGIKIGGEKNRVVGL